MRAADRTDGVTAPDASPNGGATSSEGAAPTEGAAPSDGVAPTDPPASSAPRIGLIWAQARGGVIGAGGTMPWHLPEDLGHFSRTTKGSPVVMGRRTWQSFPPRFRPLPGRTNIVITSDDTFADEGALRAETLDEALARARDTLATDPDDSRIPTIWVIGGGRVYREVMDRADLLMVTEIDLEVDGDTTAPTIPTDFRVVTTDPDLATAGSPSWHTSRTGLRFRILTYRR